MSRGNTGHDSKVDVDTNLITIKRHQTIKTKAEGRRLELDYYFQILLSSTFVVQVCQGTCLCSPSPEGYGKGKVLYCYGEVSRSRS